MEILVHRESSCRPTQSRVSIRVRCGKWQLWMLLGQRGGNCGCCWGREVGIVDAVGAERWELWMLLGAERWQCVFPCVSQTGEAKCELEFVGLTGLASQRQLGKSVCLSCNPFAGPRVSGAHFRLVFSLSLIFLLLLLFSSLPHLTRLWH